MSLIIVGKNENGKPTRMTTDKGKEVLKILFSEENETLKKGVVKGKDLSAWHLATFFQNPLNDNISNIIEKIEEILGNEFGDLIRTTMNDVGNC